MTALRGHLRQRSQGTTLLFGAASHSCLSRLVSQQRNPRGGMTMRRLALLLGLLVSSVAFAATAAATPPTIEEFHDEISFDIDCGGGVLLHEDAVVDDRVTTFFDKAGNPTRVQIHERFVGVITNPDGETFRDPGFFTVLIDLAGTPDDQSDDTVSIAGMFFAITVPGVGIVAQDTGLITFNPDGSVVIHGPHEVFVQGLEPLICPVLV